MARIPEAENGRLKSSISLQRLAEAKGVVLRKRGEELMGLCPFHEDHSPSLVINPSKNVWHCLGACQTGGSVIDWVMKAEGVSFRHAVEILRRDFSPLVAATAVSEKISNIAPLTEMKRVISEDADDQQCLRQVLNYYTATLKESPEALAYLQKRGIDSAEAVELFRLGFANRTLGYHIPAKGSAEGTALRGRLQEMGIYRASGHEHFTGSLVIPVTDERGIVHEVYGRKINDNLRKGTPLHLYLPGPHRGVWNVSALKASKEVILCESLIDALTFWCAGFRNVTASYGIEGFTDDHLAAFKQYHTERVLIAYDRDEPGDRAASSLAAKLMAEGIECFRVQFPRGMDANEYALQVTPAAKSLGLVIRQAAWMGRGRGTQGWPQGSVTSGQGSVKMATKGEKEHGEELSGFERVAEVGGAHSSSIRSDEGLSEDRAVRADGSDTKGSGECGRQYCGGSSASASQGVSAGAVHREGQLGGGRHPAGGVDEAELHHEGATANNREEDRRDTANAGGPDPILASPLGLPPTDPCPLTTDHQEHEVVLSTGDRRWRIRGLEKNLSYSLLKVNLLVARDDSAAFHVDTFDLYSVRQRRLFIKQAADELSVEESVIKRDLGTVLLKLEALQAEQVRRTLEPQHKAVTLSEGETTAAMDLLTDPSLLDRILSDFEQCGVVGEQTNKLVGYLAAVSRKLEEPLAIVVQSSSAAGKSSLMEAILSFFPPEERVQYSAMTGQSLFYMGEADLRHKILAIAEEEGAEKATYALKLLQSEGELTIASTGKDPATGRLETQEYRVEGPVMIFLTTTAIEIDEELLNRCIVLTVDEEREQTRAIHKLQRERQTLEGLLARRESDGLRTLHQNAQRLLHPLLVANPFARELTFLDDRTRTRRDHMKYLTLIRAIALLHQHQRPIRQVTHQGQPVAYIEVTLDDIATANRLAHQVLGRSLDELAPQTRRLLTAMDEMVTERCNELGMSREDYRFTRREVREYSGLGNTQLKIHMHRLEELEYLIVHRGGRGQQFVYELAYNGEGRHGEPFIPGLLDVERLKQEGYDENRSGPNADRSGANHDLSGTGRPQVGPKSGGCRGADRPLSLNDPGEVKPLNGKTPKIAYPDREKNTPYIGRRTELTADSGTGR